MNMSLDNKEETKYRRAKDRKAQEKHKTAIRYLKNIPNQRQHRNNLQCLPVSVLCGKGKPI
jgi:glycerol-3-phosphate O-acyltransferase